jgi:hypothetical protein
VPDTWQARPLPPTRYAREGFVASPRIADWEQQAGTVGGAEAFWIDTGDLNLPSDYFYLVARGPVVGSLIADKSCRMLKQQVYLDNRPDFTGRTRSDGDYFASASGVCGPASKRVRWEYVVVAPGFGPIRHIGIPTSGLYVVMAAVSGPRAGVLLQELIDSTRFHGTSITQMVDAARGVQ